MLRILAIDDSPSILQMAELILTDAGYQVVTCTDGKEAIRLLRDESFDLILTDIYMPDQDGLEVIRERRRLCPNVPVIAMSGMSGPHSMLGVAKQMGACQTVQKPFSRSDLLAAVEAALGASPPGPEPAQRK